MKKIFIIVAFIFNINVTLLNANPTITFDNKKFIPLTTYKAINYLTRHNFEIIHNLQTKDSLALTTKTNSDITLFIHSLSSFSYVNGISVTVLITPESLNPDANENTNALNILTQQTFEEIANALAFLPCSNKTNFLRNGFKCPTAYKVHYSLYEGGLNNIREWFGINPDRQLIININPEPRIQSEKNTDKTSKTK